MSRFSANSFKDNPLFLQSTVAIIAIEAIALLFLYQGRLEFDNKAGLAVFGGLPVLVLGLIQLHSSGVIQRANLVKDLASKVHTDKELSETFHALIYLYTDKRYDIYSHAPQSERAEQNRNKRDGLRFFTLDELEGSEEERRLDSFLGYIDIIGYHYTRGLIQMNDLAGVLGFHLATIQSRKVIKEYRESVHGFWQSGSRIGVHYGVNAAPLRHLDSLLSDYEMYCRKHARVL